MALITPSKFIALKASVKAECLRRNQQGSVAGYGGSAYDFSRTPLTNQTVIREFYEKIATPINAIDGTTPTSGNKIIKDSDLDTMQAKVNALTNKPMSPGSSDTGCAASCTGLCYSGCAGTCTSCTSCTGCTSCSGCSGCGGCDGGCWNTCTSCTGSCTGGCSSCSGGCYGGCRADCATSCVHSCDGTCSGGCGDACDGCTGCGGSCSVGCGSSCSSGCSGTVTSW